MQHFAEYLLSLASTKWGLVAMVSHAFLESFIMPLAHELFLIPVALARPHLSFLFAFISTVASMCGITVGYNLGRWGGRNILLTFFKPRQIILAKREIHRYDVWAIALACFTPFPVKVFALIAGTVHLNFRKMILVAFFARGARYFLVALFIFFYGHQAREFLIHSFGTVMTLLFVLTVLGGLAWNWFTQRLAKKEMREQSTA